MNVDWTDHHCGRQGWVFPDRDHSATVVHYDARGRLLWCAVDPLCQGSGPTSVPRVGWYDDRVFPIRLVVAAHSFPEVVEFFLGHDVLHFQGPAKEDLALEAKP